MTNISIDLSKNCDPLVIGCLSDLNHAAKDLDIEFLVVGALARILILEQYYHLPTGVATLDLDIGISVVDWAHYKKLKNALISTGSFISDKKAFHRLLYMNQPPVDIIPFGTVATSDGLIRWPPDQSIEMNVTGFQDALNDATLVHLAEGLDILFVSPPGMVILKLIAWRDRHNEFPTKDAFDIATLLKYYPDIGDDERIFNEYPDLMENENFDFEIAGVRMLGRDMVKIMSPQTKGVVSDILTFYTDPDENDDLVNAIRVHLPDKNYERGLTFLQSLKAEISGT
jgi:predicted nucleotidyltransferase